VKTAVLKSKIDAKCKRSKNRTFGIGISRPIVLVLKTLIETCSVFIMPEAVHDN